MSRSAATTRNRQLGGTSLLFGAASTDKVTFVAPASFDTAIQSAFTAAAFVKMRTTGGGGVGRVFDLNNSGTGGFQLLINGTLLQAEIGFTSIARFIPPANSLKIGTWTRLLMTWLSTDNRPKLYIDSVLPTDVSGNNKSGTQSNIAGTTVAIGNRSIDNARNWDGWIDDVIMWNRVLTAAEIVADAKGIYATSGQILNFSFDEGSGTTVTDSSSTGIVGTITGATFNTSVPLPKRTTASSRSAATTRLAV